MAYILRAHFKILWVEHKLSKHPSGTTVGSNPSAAIKLYMGCFALEESCYFLRSAGDVSPLSSGQALFLSRCFHGWKQSDGKQWQAVLPKQHQHSAACSSH